MSTYNEFNIALLMWYRLSEEIHYRYQRHHYDKISGGR